MVRSQWQNLNGTWDYMGGKSQADPTKVDVPPAFPAKTEKIRVPFPPESDLSGIARKDETYLWYRRTVSIPGEWKGKNVLLHFDAVDRICSVFVNGKKVGSHEGGYDNFCFDITKYLKNGSNTIVLGAYDPNDGKAASGKNGPKGDYICTSGIWQTVWMEPVEIEHISNIKLIPNLKDNTLNITAFSDNGKNMKIEAVASVNGKVVARSSGNANAAFALKINKPHLWSPDVRFSTT